MLKGLRVRFPRISLLSSIHKTINVTSFKLPGCFVIVGRSIARQYKCMIRSFVHLTRPPTCARPFLLISLTNEEHARMTFRRLIESPGDVRLESGNVRNLSTARREIISGIAGPAELARYTPGNTARLFEMRAPPTYEGTTTIFQAKRHTYPDVPPRMF